MDAKQLHHRLTFTSLKRVVASTVLAALALNTLLIEGRLTLPAPVRDLFRLEQVHAAVGINKIINYQGKVSAINGSAIGNGSYNMRFRIYDAATGGNLLWTEEWTNSTTRATMTGGLFTVGLGTHVTMDGAVNFNTDNLYLQIEFDPGNDGTFEEVFSPRRKFGSVPYAFNTDTLDGLDSTEFLRKNQDNTMTGSITINNDTGLTVRGAISGALIHASGNLTTSGSLIVEGDVTLRSYTSCAVITTDGSGNLGCGESTTNTGSIIAIGDGRYVKKSGDTMTGTLILTPVSGLALNAKGTISGALITQNGAGNNYFMGNVGIGTTSPTVALDVIGNFRTGNAFQSLGFTGGSATELKLSVQGNQTAQFIFNAAGVDPFIGLYAYGAATRPGEMVIDYKDAASFRIYKDSTNVATFLNSGNVGIGSAAPKTKLEVNGSMSGASLFISSSMSGAGLTDCDLTNKSLQWDATTERFSCATISGITNTGAVITIGDSRYVKKQGDTMTGTLVINPATGYALNARGTISGALITQNGAGNNYFMGNVGVGTRITSSMLTVAGAMSGTALHAKGNDILASFTRSTANNAVIAIGNIGSAHRYFGYNTMDQFVLSANSSLSSPIFTASYSNGRVGIGSSSPKAKLDVAGTISGALITQNGAGNNYFMGNVGIGTTSPNAKLQVVSSSSAFTNVASFTNDTLASGNVGVNIKLGNTSGLGASGGYGTIRAGRWDTSDRGLRLIGQSQTEAETTYIHLNGQAGDIIFGTNASVTGTEKMRLNSAGNLGIGTATPKSKLDVAGSISGASLYISSSMSGAGLTDCDLTNKSLQWDATTERFSCATISGITNTGAVITIGDSRYVKKQGDTMTGTLVINPASGYALNARGTISGALITQNGAGNNYFMGNVGIGTMSPTSTLTLKDGFGDLSIDFKDSSFDISRLKILVAGDQTSQITSYYSLALDSTYDDLLFKVGGTTIITIDNATDSVGIGTSTPKAKFAVAGSISGATLYISSSMSGAGLTDCDLTNKSLQWDATTERFSCATISGITNTGAVITIGDSRYVKKQGDTMTGALVINVTGGSNTTLGLNVLNTISGAVIRAQKALASSGTLAVEGDANIDGSTFYVDSANNRVGIGTTSTTQTLTVQGSIGIDDQINHRLDSGLYVKFSNGLDSVNIGTSGATRLTVNSGGYVGIGTSPKAKLDVAGTISGALITQNGAGSNYFMGNVGVGTTAPGTKLEIADGAGNSIQSNGSYVRSRYSGDPASTYRFSLTSNTLADFGMSIGNEAGLLLRSGDGTTRSVIATQEDDLAFFTNGTTNANATEKVRITSAGLVGIGTTAPKAKLDVAGSISGASLYISSSMSGAGLTDCDLTNKSLQWDATTERFSCATISGITNTGAVITIGDSRYVKKQGDTMTGTLVINPATGYALNARGTISGALITQNGAGNNYFMGNVGIGTMSPTDILSVRKDQNSITGISVTNSSPGTSAISQLSATTNGNSISLTQYPSLYSDSNLADSGVVRTSYGMRFLMNSYANQSPGGAFIWYSGWQTSVSEVMRLTGDGKLGLGTNSPKAKLDVAGTISGALITQNGAGSNYFMGNVGIGTMSPSEKLHVAGNIRSTGYMDIGPSQGLRLRHDGANSYITGSVGDILMNTGTANDLILQTNGTTRQTIDALGNVNFNNGKLYMVYTGNIGIGTTTPKTKLEVNGSMSGASLYISSSMSGAGLTDCDLTNKSLQWDATTERFSCATISGITNTGAVITIGDSRYVKKQGDTMTGALVISMNANYAVGSGALAVTNNKEFSTGAYIYSSGTVLALDTDNRFGASKHILFGYRGVFDTNLYRSNVSTLKTDGSLYVMAHLSGATFGGAGLTDCDASTQKLQWDASTNTFSCGTISTGTNTGAVITIGDSRYVKKQGDTMTGTLVINPATGYALNARGTISGALITQNGAGSNYFLGNVGIGTKTPTGKLEVYGTNSSLIINTGDNATDATLRFSHRDTAWGDTQHKTAIIAPSTGSYGRSTGLYFALNSLSDNTNATITDTKLAILESGNIGIGTTSPTANLHIRNASGAAVLRLESRLDTNTDASGAILQLVRRNSGPDAMVTFSNDATQIASIGLDGDGSNNFRIQTNSLNSMTVEHGTAANTLYLTQAGFVGIGTALPKTKLEVIGTISGALITQNGAGSNYFMGNVGIGTTAPSNTLDVAGTIESDLDSLGDVGGDWFVGKHDNSASALKFSSVFPATNHYYNKITSVANSNVASGRARSLLIDASSFDTGSDQTTNAVIMLNAHANGSALSNSTLMGVYNNGTERFAVTPTGTRVAGNLRAAGNISGATLYISSSMSGAGLTDCDASGQKLTWDEATGRFSCGLADSVNSGAVLVIADSRYVKKQGDTMTGALVINVAGGSNTTLGLNVLNTISGAVIRAQKALASSGTLAVEGATTLNGNLIIGDTASDSITFNASTATLNNNLNLDSNTLFIDKTKNAIGIGTGSMNSFDKLKVMGRIAVQGDQSAMLHNSTAGSAKWLTGLRDDMGAEENAYVMFGYDNGKKFVFEQSGNLGINKSNASANLDVAGSISGATLYISSSMSGAGLTDCDLTNKSLQWDATTERFSCATISGITNTGAVITIGDSRYVKKQGDTMTGTLVINPATGYALNARGTISGALITQNGAGNNYFMGNVGIGTMTPATKLGVHGDGITLTSPSYSGTLTIKHAANNTMQFINSNIGAFMTVGAGNSVNFGSQVVQSTVRGAVLSNTTGGAALLTQEGNVHLVTTSGNVGIGTTTPKSKLDVAGSISGATLYISSSMSGAGLTDCDLTNKSLQWDATTERFSCATISGITNTGAVITIGDSRYVKKQGDTMTGTLVINPATGYALNARGTISGSSLWVSGTTNLANGMAKFYGLNRTLPTTVNNIVEIGNFNIGSGGGSLRISITVSDSGFSLSKQYLIPLSYNETNNVWQLVQPISDAGAYGGTQDYELDINTFNGTTYLRIRRTAGTAAGTARVIIQYEGVNNPTFTESSTTASVTAPTVFYSAASLRQLGGKVGINTVAPKATLDVVGTISGALITQNGAGNNYFMGNVGIGTTSPLATFDVKGNGSSFVRTHANISGQGAQYNTITSGAGIELAGYYDSVRYGMFVNNTNGFQLMNKTSGESFDFTGASAAVNRLVLKHAGLSYYPSLILDATSADEVGLYVPGGFGSNTMGFITDRTERMRINAVGNVGIGTTAPEAKLDVAGSISGASLYISSSMSGAGLTDCDLSTQKLQWDATTERFSCGTISTGTNTGAVITIGDSRYVKKQGDTMTGALVINVTGGSNTTLGLNVLNTISGAVIRAQKALASSGTLAVEGGATIDGSTFTVDSTNNRVGIGTTNPSATLTLNASASTSISDFTQGLPNAGMLIESSYGVGNYLPGLFWSTSNNNSTKPKAGIWTQTNSDGSDMFFGTSNSYGTGITNTALVINQSGNVGIGTTSPASALHVVNATKQGSGALIVNQQAEFGTGAYIYASGASVLALDTHNRFGDSKHILFGYQGVFDTNLYRSDVSTLKTDGSLYVMAHLSGATFGGAGLTDCDASSQKLQWDATTKKFSCGTVTASVSTGAVIAIGDTRYVKKQGDTMTGALVIRPTAGTGIVGLNVAATMSGRSLYVSNNTTLAGALVTQSDITATGGNYSFTTSGNTGNGFTISGTKDSNVAAFRVVDAGTDVFWVDGSGKVGVGTTSPTEKLEVAGNIELSGGSRTLRVDSGNSLTLMATDANSQIVIGPGTGTTYQAYLHTFNETGVGEVMRINGGNVGIGTASPGAKLHTLSTTEQLRLGYDATHYLSFTVNSSGDGTIDLNTAGRTLTLSDNVATLNNLTVGNTVTADSYILSDISNAGMFTNGTLVEIRGNGSMPFISGGWNADTIIQPTRTTSADGLGDVGINVNGARALTVENTNGNVGIGTTSPKSKLDVVGGISGATLYVSSSMSGAGLTDCDLSTQKLQWDATTERFSCGTVSAGTNTGAVLAIGDSRYVKKQGDTMTGTLVINPATGYALNARGTISGALITQNGAGNNYFRGNIGIGTTTPTTALEVVGAMSGSQVYASGKSAFGNLPGSINLTSGTVLQLLDTTNAGVRFYDGTQNYSMRMASNNLFLTNSQYANGSGLAIASDGTVHFTQSTNLNGSASVNVETPDGSLGLDVIVESHTPSDTTAFQVSQWGTTPQITFSSLGGAVFNEEGNNADFRIEGDTNANLFFLDAGTSRIGIGTNAPKAMLDVVGSISGATLYVSNSMSGAGLTDCDLSTQKLQWDATTERFSCGTLSAGTNTGAVLAIGDSRYVKKQGDTMTGALVINITGGSNNTLGLNVLNTISGSVIRAQKALASSGTLAVEGITNLNGNLTIGDESADTVTVNSNAWTFANDTNIALTGGVNGLSFDTDTLSIDATNNRVGIGTTSPAGKLEIHSSGTADFYLTGDYTTARLEASDRDYSVDLGLWQNEGSARTYGAYLSVDAATSDFHITKRTAGNDTRAITILNNGAYVGIGTTAPKTKLEVAGAISGSLITQNGAGNNYFRGNLGIGTTSPARTFHMSTAANNYMRLQATNANTYAGIEFQNDAKTFTAGINSADSFVIAPAGSFAGGSILEFESSAYAGSIVAKAGGNILLATNGGNVGIDTLNPGSRLSVSGSVIIGDNIGTAAAKAQLDVIGTISGSALTISSLKSCDTIDTDANGNFVCGTDNGGSSGLSMTDGDARYVNTSGDTMTGALVINVTGGNNNTLGLNVLNTISGAVIRAQKTLASSGTLAVEGITNLNGNLIIGDASADTVTVNSNAWTFANDTNIALTGGVNGLSFDTNTLSIDATNNRVGIGTTTPEGDLHVYSSAAKFFVESSQGGGEWVRFSAGTAGSSMKFSDTGTFSIGPVTDKTDTNVIEDFYMETNGRIGINTSTTNARFSIQSDGTDDILNLFETGGSEVFTVLESGNVGIGTTAPKAKLDVVGTISGSTIHAADLSNCNGNNTVKADADGTLYCATDEGGGGSSSKWTDGGAITYLTSTSDDLAIGGSSAAAPFFFDTSAALLAVTNVDVSGTTELNTLDVSGATTLQSGTITLSSFASCTLKTDASGNITCGTDTDTNTTYTAGTGLNLSGTQFTLSHLGIQNLSDPNADRIMFWDDSAGASAWLTMGTNLSIVGTTLNATDTNTTYTANNGLTLNGTVMELGGTLNRNTTVTQAGFNMIFNLSSTGDFEIQDAGTTAFKVLDTGDIQLGDNNEIYVDTSAGSVGIGTTAPKSKLDVMGTISGSTIHAADLSNCNGNNTVKADADGTLYCATDEGGGGSSSKWTDGGAITYLTTTTDDLAIGGSSSAAPFFFDTSAALLAVTNVDVSGTTELNTLDVSGATTLQSGTITLSSFANCTLKTDGSGNMTCGTDANTDNQNLFQTFSVSGQSNVVADSATDALTLVAGSNVTITTNATSDSITIAATDTNTTYTAGTGLNLSGTQFTLSHLGLQNLTDPNADRVMFWDDSAGASAWLTMGTNLSIVGTTLNATDTNTTYTANNGLTLNGTIMELGGTLNRNTTVTQGVYNLLYNLSSTGDFEIQDAGTTAFKVLDTGDIQLGNNNEIYVDTSAGSVGIGTVAPKAKLDVVGTMSGSRVYASTALTTSGVLVIESLSKTGSGAATIVGAEFQTGAYVFGSGAPVLALDSYGPGRGAKHILFGYKGNFDTSIYRHNDPGISIKAETNQSTDNVLRVMSNNGSTDNTVFRVQANGQVFSDGAYASTGADYAEWFYAGNQKLQPGEVVCIDVTRNNAVKRCERNADSNIMGIVSTNPAFIGNSIGGASGIMPPGYALVGLIGQVPAKVTSEGGEIRPGDSLTAASKAGFARKASPGDSTVGVALEGMKDSEGIVNVLISRRNQSLTVEAVEENVLKTIASMEIDDEVQLMVSSALGDLNVDAQISTEVERQLAGMQTQQQTIEAIQSELSMLKTKLADMHELLEAAPSVSSGSTQPIAQSSQLTAHSSLTASSLELDNTLVTGGDARIGGDLHIDGTITASSLFVPNGLSVDGGMVMNGLLDTAELRVSSGAVIDGMLRVNGGMAFGSGSFLDLREASVYIADLIVENSLFVMGDVTIEGLALFLKDVEIKGELIVSNKQAGFAMIPKDSTSVIVNFGTGFTATPVVTASPDVPVLYAVSKTTATGFTLRLAGPAPEDVMFSWHALSVGAPLTFTAQVTDEGTMVFPLDSRNIPVSSNMAWNACIRNIPMFDSEGKPLSCSRYHDAYTWMHPDLGISFIWNTSMTPAYLKVPDGYKPTVTEDAASVEGAITPDKEIIEEEVSEEEVPATDTDDTEEVTVTPVEDTEEQFGPEQPAASTGTAAPVTTTQPAAEPAPAPAAEEPAPAPETTEPAPTEPAPAPTTMTEPAPATTEPVPAPATTTQTAPAPAPITTTSEPASAPATTEATVTE